MWKNSPWYSATFLVLLVWRKVALVLLLCLARVLSLFALGFIVFALDMANLARVSASPFYKFALSVEGALGLHGVISPFSL